MEEEKLPIPVIEKTGLSEDYFNAWHVMGPLSGNGVLQMPVQTYGQYMRQQWEPFLDRIMARANSSWLAALDDIVSEYNGQLPLPKRQQKKKFDDYFLKAVTIVNGTYKQGG